MLVSGPTGTRASEDVAHRHRANPRRTHSGPQRFLCLLGSPLPGRLSFQGLATEAAQLCLAFPSPCLLRRGARALLTSPGSPGPGFLLVGAQVLTSPLGHEGPHLLP